LCLMGSGRENVFVSVCVVLSEEYLDEALGFV
jgi:hypothetical protein